jgi:hypothetical protein
MKMKISQLRSVIREVLRDELGREATDECRVCGGQGEVAGEFCATCSGTGEELAYGATRPGIGRGPLPWRM